MLVVGNSYCRIASSCRRIAGVTRTPRYLCDAVKVPGTEGQALLMETLDILADPKAMAGLRKGEKDIRRGRIRSWAKIKASLGRPQGRTLKPGQASSTSKSTDK